MKIKKLFCILFATALLLAGCSSPAPQAVTEPETVTEPDPADPQEQIKLLANSVDIWRVPNDLEYEPYYYTVTDLDHNGRLEIIGASTQGTGIYTYGVVYEVGADFSSVQECMTPCKENSDLPELIMNSAPAAYDEAAHSYDYLFTNDTRNGAAEHYHRRRPPHRRRADLHRPGQQLRPLHRLRRRTARIRHPRRGFLPPILRG